ncbi:Erf4 domain-containing protein [Meloidogyne graminicola]|uniref:Ras modification protein ERF4 n=1 Tax=Meloidogyne graminicola TaxID=189291 RepID=A0A8T0A0T5_9BILA|nr:Erf4 domain-containing protein [Meloidogyne graminicola]
MALNNFDSHGKRRILLNECKKIYIQRDYSRALVIRFSTEFPEELENYVDNKLWTDFVNNLNQIYFDAEKLSSRAYLENIISLLTCHLSRLCFKSYWTKKLEEAEFLIDEINQQHFVKEGIYVGNPLDKGFRVIEVVLLDEPFTACTEKLEKGSTPIQGLQPR